MDSSLRETMDLWDANLVEARKEAVKDLVEFPGFVLMFQKGSRLFAAPEESRLVFAKLKSDEDEDWKKEATFGAFDLIKALMGEKTQSLFGNEDMPSIKIIIDKEQMCKILDKKAADSHDPIAGIKKVLELLSGDDE